MAIKKTRNTFEGGIDQDTSFELVKNNTATSLKNGMITKNGEQGALTTTSGFDSITKINYDGFNRKVYRLKITAPIPNNETLILMGGSPGKIRAVGIVNNTTDLFNSINNSGIVIPINMNGLYKNDDYVYIYEQYLITSFHANLEVTTMPLDTDNVLLGVKEISIDKNRNLIFYFSYNHSSLTLCLHMLEYNTNNNAILNSDIIFKEIITLDYIDSENIIYNKESESKHSFYWCDGVNPDKVIYFNISLDSNDYADGIAFVDALRAEIYDQSENNLNQIPNVFFPKPQLYDLIKDDTNGKLKAGEAVLFFYRLKKNGVPTSISYFSDTLFIPSTDIFIPGILKSEIKYTLSETSRCLSQFSVTDASTAYDFIEGYVIHYDYTGLQKIRKLNDQTIKPEVIFSYNELFDESELEEVDLSSLYNFDAFDNIAKEQIVYKNRLIKANLKDSTIEALQSFDARAYRFKSTTDVIVADRQKAKLYGANGGLEYTLDGTSGTLAAEFATVAETADAVNPYNDEYTDFATWQTDEQYAYKADGLTLGGQGANISYNFRQKSVEDFKVLDSSMNFLNHLHSNFDTKLTQISTIRTPNQKKVSTGNITSFDYTSKVFQGGEVYRFYLVLWKGTVPTSSKWIGDIKFPENEDILNNTVPFYADGVRLQGWQIDFDIDTSSIKKECSAVSIGYVLRDYDNKSVLATLPTVSPYHTGDQIVDNGAYQNLVTFKYDHLNSDYLKNIATNEPASYPASYTANAQADITDELIPKLKLFPFNVSDLGIAKIDESSLYLKKIGYLDYRKSVKQINIQNYINVFGETIVRLTNSTSSTHELIEITSLGELTGNSVELKPLLPNLNDDLILYNFNTMGLYDIVNGTTDVQFTPKVDVSPIEGTISSKSFAILDSGYTEESDKFSLVSIRKPVTDQYGGNSYNSRASNTVVLNSYVEVSTEDAITVMPQGDTYVNYCDQKLDFTRNTGGTLVYSSNGALFPMESGLNIYGVGENQVDINAGKRWSDFPTNNSDQAGSFIGAFNDAKFFRSINAVGVNAASDMVLDSYISNVTSNVLTNSLNSSNPTGIKISEKKIYGQNADSWAAFKINNLKNLNPIWGEINKMSSIGNDLFIFQRDAISQQFVERTATQISDASQIVLGTGDVLDEHVYIRKNSGVLHPRQVLDVDNDLVFLDVIRKEFQSLKKGEILGMKKYFDNMDIDENLNFNYEFSLIYDRQSKMVFMSPEKYTGSNSNNVIMYDATLQAISSDGSFNSMTIDKGLYTGLNNMLSFTKINDMGVGNNEPGIQFFRYNHTFPNTWFDEANKKLEASFVINEGVDMVKTFDNLFVQYEVENSSGVDVPALLPESIQVTTNYQDTGVIALTTTNFTRQGRYWRFTIPRNAGGVDRIRDYWAEVRIIFPATTNQIKLIEVITSYRYSNLK